VSRDEGLLPLCPRHGLARIKHATIHSECLGGGHAPMCGPVHEKSLRCGARPQRRSCRLVNHASTAEPRRHPDSGSLVDLRYSKVLQLPFYGVPGEVRWKVVHAAATGARWQRIIIFDERVELLPPPWQTLNVATIDCSIEGKLALGKGRKRRSNNQTGLDQNSSLVITKSRRDTHFCLVRCLHLYTHYIMKT